MDETQLQRLENKFDKFVEYVQAEFSNQRAEMTAIRTELRTETTAIKAELRAETTAIREELRAETSAIREELRAETTGIREEIGTLRMEMRERFENMTDRLKRIEDYYAGLNFEMIRVGREIEKARGEVEEVRTMVMRLESRTLETQLGVSQLREDIQQRFRVVNERLAGVERQLAA